jgi:hypothetical protein
VFLDSTLKTRYLLYVYVKAHVCVKWLRRSWINSLALTYLLLLYSLLWNQRPLTFQRTLERCNDDLLPSDSIQDWCLPVRHKILKEKSLKTKLCHQTSPKYTEGKLLRISGQLTVSTRLNKPLPKEYLFFSLDIDISTLISFTFSAWMMSLFYLKGWLLGRLLRRNLFAYVCKLSGQMVREHLD